MRDHTADLVAALAALLPPDADAAALADALWLAAAAQPADAPSPAVAATGVASPAPPATPAPAAAPAPPAAPPEEPPHRTATPLYEPPAADPTGPRVEVAAARALPHALDAGRALRPFKRRYPRGPRRTLDLDATVDAYTRTGELLPVLRPTPERWFEVVVLTDTGPTMEIWQDTLAEFTTLLTGLGAFRRIRRLHLHLDPHPAVTDTRGRPVPPARLPQRRRLVLVLTDCAGPQWHRPAIWQLLHTLGRPRPHRPAQPAPRPPAPPHRPRPPRRPGPAPPARRPQHRTRPPPYRCCSPPPSAPTRTGCRCPPPPSPPHSLRRWADAMMRGAAAGHDAVLVPAAGTLVSPFATPEDDTEAADPALRAAAFLHTASPAARRLAALCSPFSRLSLPLLRLVRQEAVPEAGTEDLAEVLTSGLLDTTTPHRPHLPPRGPRRPRPTSPATTPGPSTPRSPTTSPPTTPAPATPSRPSPPPTSPPTSSPSPPPPPTSSPSSPRPAAPASRSPGNSRPSRTRRGARPS
ncbi:SAV_2336 N-terminal domain-related protein [Kitasatospora cheerisanensis]|uniref:Uncharacterized protein n=1 Tax=Kitasatospora cheerisanensis KCTC 2395 TaxID=1348663 RepID=A0A066YSU1_9ACTN|nr:SAV_2336 N-terminal domain-related protein [Kitasatospora cheerisanensis]KDN81000.1 hypothetical protein KCH_70940 [Kitasatospora cheerisanensis KCTC 2395]